MGSSLHSNDEPPRPLKPRKFYFYCRLAVSNNRRSHRIAARIVRYYQMGHSVPVKML